MSVPGPQAIRQQIPPVGWKLSIQVVPRRVCKAKAEFGEGLVVKSVAKDCFKDLQAVLADFYSEEKIAKMAVQQQRRWEKGDPFSGFIVYQNDKPIGWVINGHSDFRGMSELFAWGTRDFSPKAKLQVVGAVINELLPILIDYKQKVNQDLESNNGEDFESIVATCSRENLSTVGKGLEMFGFTRCSPEKLNELMKTRWKKEEIPEVETRSIDGEDYGVYEHPYLKVERFLYIREELPQQAPSNL